MQISYRKIWTNWPKTSKNHDFNQFPPLKLPLLGFPPKKKSRKGVTFANSIRTSSSYLGPPFHRGLVVISDMLTAKSDDSSMMPIVLSKKTWRVLVYMYMYLDNMFCRFFKVPHLSFGVQRKTVSPQIVSTNPRDCTKIRICGPIQVPADNNNQQQHHQRMKPKQKVGARLQLIIAKTNFSNISFCIWNLQFHSRIPIIPSEACDTSSLRGSITLR